MSEKRTYGDSCGIARALDLVGERWALLVVRELLLGPKRFTDLRAGLPHVSPDVLAQRLRDMETAGVVRRRKLPPPAAAHVYELTEWGSALEPVLVSLGRWGSRAALPLQAGELSPDALAVALKSMFAGDATVDRSYHVRLGEHGFSVRVLGGELEVAREDASPPEAALALETDPGTLTALLWHGGSVDDALGTGALRLRGSRDELDRFLALFAIPTAA